MKKLKEFLILFLVLTLVLALVIGLYGFESGYGELRATDILVYLFGTFVCAGVLTYSRAEPNNLG